MKNVKITWKNDDTGESGETNLVQFVPYNIKNGEIRQIVETTDEDGVVDTVESFWIFTGAKLSASSAVIAAEAAGAPAI